MKMTSLLPDHSSRMNQLFPLPTQKRLIDRGTIIDFSLEALISERDIKNTWQKKSYRINQTPRHPLRTELQFHLFPQYPSLKGQAINDDEITIKAQTILRHPPVCSKKRGAIG
ncbi:hypothetical protein TNIN_2631 [Trichonephila inaurata madagascariensis]|uniref:Uncharacterized protein n=1 Tax=Trichonephila inaurata madagascariensis TaxID=2747483 RepID=A0A8X6MAI6_9ARAC|nr:hypothetical protein TNIN_2631 [Trichonephila inaurata madagascariensis]